MRNIEKLVKKLKKPVLDTASKTNAAVVKDIGGCNDPDLNNDSTSRTFTEIDRHKKYDILLNLEKASALTLLYLANDIGPAHGYGGLGWQDLFAERTQLGETQWIPMYLVKTMSAQYKTNDDCMFRVWFCLPGLVHVEVDDDGTWTVEDIVSFPEWMMIG